LANYLFAIYGEASPSTRSCSIVVSIAAVAAVAAVAAPPRNRNNYSDYISARFSDRQLDRAQPADSARDSRDRICGDTVRSLSDAISIIDGREILNDIARSGG
jgi:hypothetical protein